MNHSQLELFLFRLAWVFFSLLALLNLSSDLGQLRHQPLLVRLITWLTIDTPLKKRLRRRASGREGEGEKSKAANVQAVVAAVRAADIYILSWPTTVSIA